MLRHDFRRRALHRPIIGICFIVACGLVAAWKLHWLPFEIGEAESGRLADVGHVDLPDLQEPGTLRIANSQQSEIYDSDIFELQNEPDVREEFDELLLEPVMASEGSRQGLQTAAPGEVNLLPPEFPNTASDPSANVIAADVAIDNANSLQPIQQTSSEVTQLIDTGVGSSELPGAPSSELEPIRRPSNDPELIEIDRLLDAGEDIAAHRMLSTIYWKRPEMRPEIEQRITMTSNLIYFSPQPHYMAPHEIQPGDQLRLIAQQYHVPWEYLAKLNRVDAQRIRAGQKLKVIKGPFHAFVDLSDYELTIHAHGYFVKRYAVGIGKDGASPIGKFAVHNKVFNPQYTDPQGRVIAADDPSNPLGEHWIDIGDSFGIHGTIEPQSIGRAESRGCIRMNNQDVAEVYDMLQNGSEVIIRR